MALLSSARVEKASAMRTVSMHAIYSHHGTRVGLTNLSAYFSQPASRTVVHPCNSTPYATLQGTIAADTHPNWSSPFSSLLTHPCALERTEAKRDQSKRAKTEGPRGRRSRDGTKQEESEVGEAPLPACLPLSLPLRAPAPASRRNVRAEKALPCPCLPSLRVGQSRRGNEQWRQRGTDGSSALRHDNSERKSAGGGATEGREGRGRSAPTSPHHNDGTVGSPPECATSPLFCPGSRPSVRLFSRALVALEEQQR
jgi:hypothetical protein